MGIGESTSKVIFLKIRHPSSAVDSDASLSSSVFDFSPGSYYTDVGRIPGVEPLLPRNCDCCIGKPG